MLFFSVTVWLKNLTESIETFLFRPVKGKQHVKTFTAVGRLCGLSTVVTPAGASYQCIERYILTQTV